MSSLGEKTRKNLEEALAGESRARNKYDWYARAAREQGYRQIADIFEETALNEKEHANLWAEALGLVSPETEKNLAAAAAGEHYEHTEMYVRMAAAAEEEGHNDIAQSFRLVARAEKAHEDRYRKLLANLESGRVFKRDEERQWKCNNCGYLYLGREAPPRCPACRQPRDYFELFCEAY